MSARVSALVLAIAVLGVVSSSEAHAADEDGVGGGGCTIPVGDGTVTVECREPAKPNKPARPTGITSPPERCVTRPAVAADGWDPADYDNIQASGYVFGAAVGGGVLRLFPNGRTEQVFSRTCPGRDAEYSWVDTSISVQDVIDDAVGRASRAVPGPSLELSPSPEAGGIVNLGLWLSLADQDPVMVRAEAGSLWAEATVTLASTSWDMGNGDVVECDGPGEAIVDTETLDEGPCGYTYRQSSPDDDPYVLSVTATWSIGYRSSGGSGSVGTLERTVSVDYDVDEIQTIGVSN